MGDGKYRGKFHLAERQIKLMTLAIYECPDNVRVMINKKMVEISERTNKHGTPQH